MKKTCEVCKVEFEKKSKVTYKQWVNTRFCSRSCVAKWLFSGSRHPRWKGGETQKLCLLCKKPFSIDKYRIRSAKFFTEKGYKTMAELSVGDKIYRLKDGILVPETILVRTLLPGNFEVYDITVETDHNFIANGYLTHNVLIGGSTFAYIDAVLIKIYYTKTFGIGVGGI